MRINPNAAAMDAETKEEKLLTFGKSQVGRDLHQDTLYLHCQPLNEVWEGVNPGSTLLVTQLHAPELPWAGPAFPPGAPSLLQAVT